MMKRTFITYKDSVYDAIEIEAYKIDKEVTDENLIYTICDFELWVALEEDYMDGVKEAIDIDNQIYFYCDSGFCACSPTEEEVIAYFKELNL